MIVAIDGPAGAGKSTVARTLASRLGFRYLDTGAMYRALTWLALDEGVPLEDGVALGDLARREPVSFEGDQVFIHGEDVTEEIQLGQQGDVVIEGRDIGTVVCPDADVKVYLVADAAERARRRVSDRPEIGEEALATDLRLRDERDAAQMTAARDAKEIDTTDLTIDEVVDRIEQLVLARSGT
jgi:cytidylate kinase